MAKAQVTLEEAMGQLNEILTQMDRDDVTLEESFQMYQDGMKLVKLCNQKIEQVEKKLVVLEENAGV